MTMAAPNISVILPTWREAPFIDGAVDSLLNQQGDFSLEVLVVHNGNDRVWADKLQARYNERYLEEHIKDPKHRGIRTVRLLFCEKKGVAAARNLGIEKAAGEWLAFCDDDDYYTLGFFENCMKALPIGSSDSILYVQGIAQRWNTNEAGELLTKRRTPYTAFEAFSGATVSFDGKNVSVGGRPVSEPERRIIKALSFNLLAKLINAEWLKSLGPFNESITSGTDALYWFDNQKKMIGSVIFAARSQESYQLRMTPDSLSFRKVDEIAMLPSAYVDGRMFETVCGRILDSVKITQAYGEAEPGVFDILSIHRPNLIAKQALPLLSFIDNPKRAEVMRRLKDQGLLDFFEKTVRDRKLKIPSAWVHDEPLVSLVMPVYNTESYLEKAMLSILNQTYRNIELICVDDGSTDTSPDILAHMAGMDERVVVIPQANGGVSSARNSGLAQAKGEFVLFLDSDDELYDQNSLALLVQEARNHSEADAVVGVYHTRYPGMRSSRAVMKLPYHELVKPVDSENCFQMALAHWCYLWQRSFLADKALEYKPYQYAQDTDFLFRAYLNGAAVYQTNVVFLTYNIAHEDSTYYKRLQEPRLACEAVYDLNETVKTAAFVHPHLKNSWRRFLLEKTTYLYVICRTRTEAGLLSQYLVDEYYPKLALSLPEAEELLCADSLAAKIMKRSQQGTLLPADEDVSMKDEAAASQNERDQRFIMRKALSFARFTDRILKKSEPAEDSEAEMERQQSAPPVHGGSFVSLIMPVYNKELYLERALDSVLGQTYRNIELICVDDGSNDKSPDILRRYAAKDERMVVITQSNSGVSAARNKGLARATGEYVLFIDADDALYGRNSLAALVQEAHRISNVDAVVGVYYKKHPGEKAYKAIMNLPFHQAIRPVESADCFQMALAHWCHLWRRQFLVEHKLEYMPYKYAQDTDFLFRAYFAGAVVYQTDVDFLIYYLSNEGSAYAKRLQEPGLAMAATLDMDDIVAEIAVSRPYLRDSWRRYVLNRTIYPYSICSKQDEGDLLSAYLTEEYYPKLELTLPEAVDLLGFESIATMVMAHSYLEILELMPPDVWKRAKRERWIIRAARRSAYIADCITDLFRPRKESLQ